MAIKVIRDICAGYREILTCGYIHRDLKPANIFIHDNQYKIGDFGFVFQIQDQNQKIVSKLVGSPLYMSP